jgi:hypothetical protein
VITRFDPPPPTLNSKDIFMAEVELTYGQLQGKVKYLERELTMARHMFTLMQRENEELFETYLRIKSGELIPLLSKAMKPERTPFSSNGHSPQRSPLDDFGD